MTFSVDISPVQFKVLSALCDQFNTQHKTAFLVPEFFDMRALEFLNHAVGAYKERRNNTILEALEKAPLSDQQSVLATLSLTDKV